MRADPVRPRVRSVSPGYLTAVGVRLVAGRELDADRHRGRAARDRDQPGGGAAVLRRRSRPVGQYVDWYPNTGKAPAPSPAQVVGVVDDIRNTSPDREPIPEIFVEYRQLLAHASSVWGDSTEQQERWRSGFCRSPIRTSG